MRGNGFASFKSTRTVPPDDADRVVLVLDLIAVSVNPGASSTDSLIRVKPMPRS